MGNEAVRKGAQDYLVKGQTPSRMLLRSIHLAIERKRMEQALRESEEKNALLANYIKLSSQAFGVGYPDGSLGMVNVAFATAK